MDETCGVCWASHSCGLPPKHDGDHDCIDEDDGGVPHETWPRNEDHRYGIDLLRYDGEFWRGHGAAESSRAEAVDGEVRRLSLC